MGTTRALNLIEESFSKYLLNGGSLTGLEENLSVALNNLPLETPRKFNVTVKLENRVSRRFFGIECFPSIKQLEKIIMYISDRDNNFSTENLIKMWRDIDEWQVMIDLLCFDRDLIPFNPKELTAMLMHEVSYVLASDQPIIKFYEAYLKGLAATPKISQVCRTPLFHLYGIPMAVSCTPRIWLDDDENLSLDISADTTLIDSGYDQHLASAVTKIVKAIGNQNTDPNNYNDVDASIMWVNRYMIDIIHRKNHLKDDLYYIAIQRNDGYFPALCSRILEILGVRLRERYTGAVAESYGTGAEAIANAEIALENYVTFFDINHAAQFESYWASAQESFMNRKTKKRVTLPSQYDIDRIAIEIDKIQNQYDRLYVLDLIYEQIQNIDMFEESLIDNPSDAKRWAPKIAQMRADLDKLRKMVLEKKNFDKTYKVWVKVPDEYAG